MTEAGTLATQDEIERYLLVNVPAASAGSVRSAGGLAVTRALLARLGEPQEEYRAVHVAGTAGKGSVSAFISAILVAHGFRVGTYTSPHVHSILERFQLGGRPAPAPEVGAALQATREAARYLSEPPSFFETATATAFSLFRDRTVDYAVIETGIGGLLDATNTIRRPDKLAVLSAIGLDHVDLLGPTLSDIAAQKAGILPRGGQAVVLGAGTEVATAIARVAARRSCALDVLAPDDEARALPATLGLALPGAHQRVNAALAVAAGARLACRDGWSLDGGRTRAALSGVHLPGRFERRRYQGHDVILDGAHNPLKLAALAATLTRALPGRDPVWVVAFKGDKAVSESLRALPAGAVVVATEYGAGGLGRPPAAPVPARLLAELAAGHALVAVPASGVGRAMDQALALARPDSPIVVTGSFYLAAEAGAYLAPADCRLGR
jgi:dihydrofolate synthase/folylpolyglutamate synthase